MAARLQGLAGADEIVIGPATRRLVGNTFELTDLGVHPLKGIVQPVRAWRVHAVLRTEGRFDAAHGGVALTALVGRDEEVALLLRHWHWARSGEGQVVLLSGEPGIGKSRLTQVLRERLKGEPHTTLRYQCSPFRLNSALYPIIEHIEFAAGFAREDTAEQKLDKLEADAGRQSGATHRSGAAVCRPPLAAHRPLSAARTLAAEAEREDARSAGRPGRGALPTPAAARSCSRMRIGSIRPARNCST